MFLKTCAMESEFLFNEGGMKGALRKNICSAELLGSWYLFEISQTLLTVKSSENLVKSGCFEKSLGWRAPILFRNKGEI